MSSPKPQPSYPSYLVKVRVKVRVRARVRAKVRVTGVGTLTLAAWVALSGHVRPSQRLGGVAACLVVARRGSCAMAVCCVSRALAVELSAAALFSTDGTSEVPSVALGSSTALGGASGQGDSVAALHAILVALGACAGSCMPHLSLAVGHARGGARGRTHEPNTKRRRGRHAADTQEMETV